TTHPVIASSPCDEAIQSHKRRPDCFVAALLAMTDLLQRSAVVPLPPCGVRGERSSLSRVRGGGATTEALPGDPHPRPLPARGRGEDRSTQYCKQSPLRRLHQPGVEVLQPRHHFVLQELQRMMPGFRLVLVV